MKYTVRYSKLAKEDIRKIYGFLNVEPYRVGVADDIVRKLRKKADSLKLFPRGSHEVLGLKDIYLTNVSGYRIFYSVNDGDRTVIILRIVHSRSALEIE